MVVSNYIKMKLIDFYADWCGPCKVLSKNLDKFKEQHPDIEIKKIDVEENEDEVTKYKVRNLPTLVLIDGDEVIKRHTGLIDLEEFVYGSENSSNG